MSDVLFYLSALGFTLGVGYAAIVWRGRPSWSTLFLATLSLLLGFTGTLGPWINGEQTILLTKALWLAPLPPCILLFGCASFLWGDDPRFRKGYFGALEGMVLAAYCFFFALGLTTTPEASPRSLAVTLPDHALGTPQTHGQCRQ